MTAINSIQLIIIEVMNMGNLKYTIIKNKNQYNQYCRQLEELVTHRVKGRAIQDEIELLILVIEKWDAEHNSFLRVDPIALLRSLMSDYNMKPKDLVELLEVSKGYVSEVLNYKKGLSKDVIRKLSKRFKVSQEAFNRKYELKISENSTSISTSIKRTRKAMAIAQ